MLERVIFTAEAVYNGVGLPLENAGVLVAKESSIDPGTVVVFGKLEDLKTQYPDARVEHVGRAILPQPVNAHTHLDLSALAFKALHPLDWLRDLAGWIAESRGSQARSGIHACFKYQCLW
jgi:aminodeoxyfutalosine deaminase